VTSPERTPPARTWWCRWAWLGGPEVTAGVLVETAAGRFSRVSVGVDAPPEGAVVLEGLTLPGLANAHSHVFHRGLRARTQVGPGSFWTWRDQMYQLANRLDPDSLYELARATFAEMVLAGITTVGEFHYLHHQPGGEPYDDPNAMGAAVIAGAESAGIRLTLIDACYLTGGIGRPLEPAQRRFGDLDASRWAERVSALADGNVERDSAGGRGMVRVAAAIHSVRAVPPRAMEVVGSWAQSRGVPLHLHLSEQPKENHDCRAAYGRSPTHLVYEHGLLGERTVAVHATHLSDDDIDTLGRTRTGVCMCPTTERDLADGIGPALGLSRAGSPLSVGSDSNAVIDLFEEARAIELDERLASGVRGGHQVEDLLGAATTGGAHALGWTDGGVIREGALADLVTLRLDTVRLAGTSAGALVAAAVFAAGAGDVDHVVIGGRPIVSGGRHLLVGDVPETLRSAISVAWARPAPAAATVP
jgi:formiminoglutamate deiminase